MDSDLKSATEGDYRLSVCSFVPQHFCVEGGGVPALDGRLLVGSRPLDSGRKMLTEFDQNTIANMTAALEYVCKKIPADRDSHELRKQLGDAMIASANNGRRTFIDLQDAGLKALENVLRPKRSKWIGWLFR